MNVPIYLRMIDDAERRLADGYRTVASGHHGEPDVYWLCQRLADQCQRHRDALAPVRERYGREPEVEEPEQLETTLLPSARTSPVGLLRDLQDLYILASFVNISWTLLQQAASALRDRELLGVIGECSADTSTQLDWLRTRMKHAAPQALVAAQ